MVDDVGKGGTLPVGEAEVGQFLAGGQWFKEGERAFAGTGGEHEGDAIEERRQVMVAEESGHCEAFRRDKRPRVDNGFYIASFGVGGGCSELHDDALEGAGAKRDVDELAGEGL
jgi:hypothetical protein